MIEHFYKDHRIIQRMRQCLLGEHLDAFSLYLYNQGYARETTRAYLRTTAHWSRYAVWAGVTDISQMDHKSGRDFFENHLPNCSCERMNCGKYADAEAAIQHILKFLVSEKIIQMPEKPEPPADMISSVLRSYDQYLQDLFGLTEKTRGIHQRQALIFLQWLKLKQCELNLSELTHQDVMEYQTECDTGGYSADWKRTLTSCLRSFLRFLRWNRIITTDLTSSVYTVRQWTLAALPKYMPFEDVQKILSVPDRKTISGKRDYAMLLLLSCLGLRSNEVVSLKKSDLNLKSGALTIRKTKTHRERVLPLTMELAEALVDYLKHRRESTPFDEVFLRTIAPYTPITSSSAVGSAVASCIHQSGIKSPTLGTHQFRHSLATHLVNNGSTIKEVADILGHVSIQSTAIYAKIQLTRLKDLGLPFPDSLMKGGVYHA